MEAMESGHRHSVGLPPMNHTDMDRVKREPNDHYTRHDGQAPGSGANTPYSPAFPRPQQPNCPQHSSSHGPAALAGLLSPPESRRTSGDDKEQKQPARLSLPSIHEALKSEQRYPPTHHSQAPTSAPLSAPLHYHQSHAASPSETSHRPFAPELPNPGPAYPAAPSQRYNTPTPGTSSTPRPQSDSFPRPPFTASSNGSRLPSLHLQTKESPPEATRPPTYYTQQSPSAPDSGPHSAVGSSSYGYANANQNPNHPYSAPPQNGLGHHLTPSSTYSAPPRYRESWRSNDANHVEEMKRNGRQPGPTYGESVKRHLDNFDLEASLNEIAEGSGRLLDFTRVYGLRTSQKLEPMHSAIPSLGEVDDLLSQGTRIQDCLKRIQHLVHAQQTAMAEKAQEQPPRYGSSSGAYDESTQSPYPDDQKRPGEFGGPDPKKRRGRAAPPGRCHSCNRAETPEWRRGPDGARTLCNACGLHYAKLTRKMGTNKSSVGSSNLRPKSVGPGSPGP